MQPNHDLTAPRNEYLFRPPRFVDACIARAVRDPRDMPMAYLLFNVAVITLPSAALVFATGSPLLGAGHCLLNAALFQERFILCMHYLHHKGLFRSRWADTFVPFVLSPFFGVPSGLYHLHHVVMHHAENNLQGWDLSSTERYQRDSVQHFVMYWLRFLLLIWVELPLYACRRGRYSSALITAACVLVFGATALKLYRHHPCGTLYVFVLPTLLNSIALMLGNWSQHMFIDPRNPRCPYHMSFTVVNDACNQRTFNDGYHTEHHLNSRRHWTELPARFMANQARYAAEDAVVFSGLDPIRVGLNVFAGRYDVLARHLVQLRTPPRTPAEVEAFLRARLVPIGSGSN